MKIWKLSSIKIQLCHQLNKIIDIQNMYPNKKTKIYFKHKILAKIPVRHGKQVNHLFLQMQWDNKYHSLCQLIISNIRLINLHLCNQPALLFLNNFLKVLICKITKIKFIVHNYLSHLLELILNIKRNKWQLLRIGNHREEYKDEKEG